MEIPLFAGRCIRKSYSDNCVTHRTQEIKALLLRCPLVRNMPLSDVSDYSLHNFGCSRRGDAVVATKVVSLV